MSLSLFEKPIGIKAWVVFSLEEGIAWAEGTNLLRKLDLSVQVRNERAVHLYQTLGFEIEGLRKRGVYKEGEYLDVYLMGKLIDGQNL